MIPHERSFKNDREVVGTWRYPDSIPLTSARQVIGPTILSTATAGTSSDNACWKPRTALSACGPKTPSTRSPLLGSPDMFRNWNSSWTPRTASLLLPYLP
jgi:hypothetical protein